MTNPLRIFIAYARKDSAYLDELRVHLRPLSRSNKIHIWYDGEIEPGEVWEAAIKKHLHEADIILLMVSPDSLNSDYFYDKEMADALERHHKGQATVVPFIIRPCGWRLTPLAALQAIPKDGKALSRWLDRDHAYADAVTVLGELVEKRLAERRSETEKKAQEQKAAVEVQRRKEQEILAARQEADRLQRQKKQQAEEVKRRQQNEDKLRRRKEIAVQQKKAQKEKLLSNLASPWTWGSILSLVLIFIFFKMCSLPNDSTDDLNPTQNPNASGDLTEKLIDPCKDKGGDVDGDGICDDKDKCINEKGPPSNNGCPVNVEKTVSHGKRKSGFEMVHVKGGTYTMGSPHDEDDRDKDECLHKVTVGDFQIGKYEVTQADWIEVMGNNPSYFNNCDDCPVEQISWDDVQEFIKRASAKYRVKYRLPTEEEWEYAARGGHKSKKYYSYAGSNILFDVAWYHTNSSSKTHPVGGKKANELGLFDMSGNVWEWCAEEWESYPYCGEAFYERSRRVVRGGSWFYFDRYCRVANRNWFNSVFRHNYLGLRLIQN